MKHGRGINDRGEKSSGIEIRMTDALAKINPTDPLILGEQASRRKRKDLCPVFFGKNMILKITKIVNFQNTSLGSGSRIFSIF
jgi:hypothetical protein